MRNPDVIAKGAYAYTQSDAELPLKEFVFFYENGKKYLLLKWCNRRGETLDGMRMTITFRDAAGAEIGKEAHSFDGLCAAANADFLLPKIEVSEDCVDFKADLKSARYGRYLYSAVEGGVAAEYVSSLQAERAVPPVRTKHTKEFDARVGRPAYPVWIGVFFCLLLAALVIFTCVRLHDFKIHAYTFLKEGVKYTFVSDPDDEDSELIVTGYHGSRKSITVYDSIEGHPVTEIAQRAFENYRELQSVTLQGSLRIGYMAFANCLYLRSVDLEQVTVIEDRAFQNCDNLQYIRAKNLSKIGDSAFYGCSYMQEVFIQNAQKPLSIGRRAFDSCYNLHTVTIDQTIEYSYNETIFEGTQNIQTLELKNFPETIGRSVTLSSLFGNPWETQCYVSKLKIGSIDAIPQNFCADLYLNSVEIGEIGDPIVGDHAFDNCRGLTEIKIPPVREIGQYAFGATRIEYFDCSETEIIAPFAFYNNYDLKNILLGDDLREIGDYAFSCCDALTSVRIPSGVEYIGMNAFENCHSIDELTLPFLGNTKNSENGMLSDIFGGTPYNLKVVTVSGPIEMLNDYVFANCDSLVSVNLPYTVVSVGQGAFMNCRRLSSFEFPTNLVSIGANAFANCISLGRITLPPPLKSIGQDAFSGCYRLYEVLNESRLDLSVPAIVGRVSEYAMKIYGAGESFAKRLESGGYTFADFDGEWFLVGYPKGQYVQELPDAVTRMGIVISSVYSVPDHLFREDDTMNRVIIPPAVRKLGKYAFFQCPMLRTVVFEEGSYLTDLEEGAFHSCSYLTSVTLPDRLKSIGFAAFSGCYSLPMIILPETLTDIKSQAFLDCSRLKTVYNLSDLPIVKTSQNFGFVAFYAEKVYKTLDETD